MAPPSPDPREHQVPPRGQVRQHPQSAASALRPCAVRALNWLCYRSRFINAAETAYAG